MISEVDESPVTSSVRSPEKQPSLEKKNVSAPAAPVQMNLPMSVQKANT